MGAERAHPFLIIQFALSKNLGMLLSRMFEDTEAAGNRPQHDSAAAGDPSEEQP